MLLTPPHSSPKMKESRNDWTKFVVLINHLLHIAPFIASYRMVFMMKLGMGLEFKI